MKIDIIKNEVVFSLTYNKIIYNLEHKKKRKSIYINQGPNKVRIFQDEIDDIIKILTKIKNLEEELKK